MSFTNYLEQKVLDHVFGAGTYAKPTLYAALFTTATGEAGGGTEVSGGGYARQPIGAMTVSGTAPTQAVNASTFEFPVATADWGTITHAAIFDAPTGGNMLDHAPLAASKRIDNGDVFRFPAGAIKVTLE
ncbi:phage tail fiber protein [Enterovirga aerilata]|uniref:Uncharacterized protein n=1 Tax=Enterovirga aerilata TaxID=2730920 RepID=A0A849ILC2_9HYPH|nr:hypothetical protein [Enterovirga sp. DB1703]NNM74753.1 hypothetical protein [Enterovirga sp. DB1703]